MALAFLSSSSSSSSKKNKQVNVGRSERSERCERCGWILHDCHTCMQSVCMRCPSAHQKCAECLHIPVCHPVGVCDDCIRLYPYHWITDEVAIGNRHSPYEPFDIIVNLNSPDGGIEPGSSDLKKKRGKYILLLGMLDCAMPEYEALATQIFDAIHVVLQRLKERIRLRQRRPARVLFHCFAGISRSVASAIYHLSRTLPHTSVEEVWRMIKQKRKIANPNEGFRRVLRLTGM